MAGHVVSSDSIKTDPDKVQTVRTWQTPVDVKELQSFIGLAITIEGLFLDYGSRSLYEQEKNYCGTRLEMLALVNNVDHFRYYLVGQKIAPED